MSKKGLDVYNHYGRYLLVHGPRCTGKTVALTDKVMRHLWENDGGVSTIIARTLSAGERGAWGDLTDPTNGRLWLWAKESGMQIVKEPCQMSNSKTLYFRIRNAHNGISECRLSSLELDAEVETKFKGGKSSQVHLVEADAFKDPLVFSTLTEMLRSMSVPEERLQFLLDTNPPREGKAHWLYEKFIRNPESDFHNIQIGIDDNPFITAKRKQEIYDKYKHDQNLLARYYFGEWVDAVSEGTCFEEVYRQDVHMVQTSTDRTKDEEDWELLNPAPDCHVIHCGWDLGAKNSAFVMGAPREVDGLFAFDLIDELVWLNETKRGLRDFVEEVLEKREFWSKRIASMYGRKSILWLDWSDSSSMNQSMSMEGTEAQLIYKYSNKRISLRPVTKGSGSILAGRELIHRLLFEERLFYASHLTAIKGMFENLMPGTGKQAVDPASPHKHVFDACRYFLGEAVPQELNRRGPNVARERGFAMAV